MRLVNYTFQNSRCLVLCLVLGAGLVAACSTSERTQTDVAATLPTGQTASRSLVGHLRALRSDELARRETASEGARLVASYIAGHFSRFDLQPVVMGGYEQTYPVRKHLLTEAHLWHLGADTTRYQLGRDFSVHPRSSTGHVDVRILPGRTPLAAARSALRLDTTAAAPAIFDPGEEGIRLVLDKRVWPVFERLQTRPTTLRATVLAREDVVTGHLVGGLYAGAEPRMRDSLLVVLVRMDVLESGIESGNAALAAFLEAARRVQTLRLERRPVPMSMYFAAYSGTEEACQGPSWLMRHLPFSRPAVTGVLHVGSRPGCWDRLGPIDVVEAGSSEAAQDQAAQLLERTLSWITSFGSMNSP